MVRTAQILPNLTHEYLRRLPTGYLLFAGECGVYLSSAVFITTYVIAMTRPRNTQVLDVNYLGRSATIMMAG
ncbi:hypothetical protein GCM10025791_22420 [Halioxenophilus aromaticivorans]|uniref:Uncharacterized protein n=1 Tax=Halioxenophilus aromaticivorans TaxID=1306992 RepID=A0AAV3U2G7_9ALTE